MMKNFCGHCCSSKHSLCNGTVSCGSQVRACDCTCRSSKRGIALSSKFLMFAMAGCMGTSTIPTLRAIDTAACVASDILPGIPDTVKTLTDSTNPSVALKVITGIVNIGGAVAKGYACYLRSSAMTNLSGGMGTEDDNKKYVAPINMVSGRAASCDLLGDKCDHNLRSAWILYYLNKSGTVKL